MRTSANRDRDKVLDNLYRLVVDDVDDVDDAQALLTQYLTELGVAQDAALIARSPEPRLLGAVSKSPSWAEYHLTKTIRDHCRNTESRLMKVSIQNKQLTFGDLSIGTAFTCETEMDEIIYMKTDGNLGYSAVELHTGNMNSDWIDSDSVTPISGKITLEST